MEHVSSPHAGGAVDAGHARSLPPFLQCHQMMLFGKISQQLCGLKKLPWSCDCRYFWGWLNAVFNKVDYERIRDVGPDRAASEWLLRCGAMVRY
ncbi:ATP synthase subunit s, mitochondrial, partial [Puma concolor]|uniref:ATP synthase subunit s, mitochondrial n=1 Tax=Puma concolor TaxID=9696 RepID=A0A6P6HH16_PUMCO